MEYLAPEHQDLAKQGLDELRGKLPSPQEIVLENLKAEELPFPRVFRKAQEYTSRNLPTASNIWEYMLSKATNKQQKFAIMNKLFQVQIATGPWKVALETAQKLFNEIITECAAESTGQQLAKEGGLGAFKLNFLRIVVVYQGRDRSTCILSQSLSCLKFDLLPRFGSSRNALYVTFFVCYQLFGVFLP